MKDFIYAALPWIVMGITVAIAAINFNNKNQDNLKKYDNDDENTDETALGLVKKEWGEDNTVYYTIDDQKDNIYTVSVRSKSTTEQLAEYEVNVKDKSVFIK